MAVFITTGTGGDTVELAKVAIAGWLQAGMITDFTAGTMGNTIRALDTAFAWFNGTSNEQCRSVRA